MFAKSDIRDMVRWPYLDKDFQNNRVTITRLQFTGNIAKISWKSI